MTALLLTAGSAAARAGMQAELIAEWDRTQDGLSARVESAAAGIGAKAWRFGAEMAQAAEFFRGVGAPDGFSTAAAQVFDRLADLKDREAAAPDADVWPRIAAGGDQAGA